MTAGGLSDFILCFYGPPGVGKTSFARGLGSDPSKVYFLSTDRGTRFAEMNRGEVDSFDAMVEHIDALADMNPFPFEFVVIDHLDDFAHMSKQHTCERLGVDSLSDAGHGKGWDAWSMTMKTVVAGLKALPCGLVFICHEKTETIRTRVLETERIVPDLDKRTHKTFIPLCDFVGYLGFRRENKKERRSLQSLPSEDVYAKDRTVRDKTAQQNKGYELVGPESNPSSAFVQTFESNPQPVTRRRSKKKAARR